MDIFTSYIPREYLALKINYRRAVLKKRSDIKVAQNIKKDGKLQYRCSAGGHRHWADSPKGKLLFNEWKLAEKIRFELESLESQWNSIYLSPLPDSFNIQTIKRSIIISDYGDTITMDRIFSIR